MAGFKAFLNRKFAGAPVWVWAAVATLTLAVAFWYFKKKQASSSATDNAANTDLGSADAGTTPDVTGSPGAGTGAPGDTSGNSGSIDEGQLLSDIEGAFQDAIAQLPNYQNEPPNTSGDGSGSSGPFTGGNARSQITEVGQSINSSHKKKPKGNAGVAKKKKTHPKKRAHKAAFPKTKTTAPPTPNYPAPFNGKAVFKEAGNKPGSNKSAFLK